MKKYRITKITVKTREIVSVQKSSTDENRFSVCPLCHTPLDGSFSTAEKNIEENQSEKQAFAFLPEEASENGK